MTTQDSDSVKAIKALEDVEKQLQDVTARVQSGASWTWQQDGVTYIDVFGFGAVTNRAGKAIAEAAPLFEVYLHALGRVPPRFKAVFEQAAALMDWIGSLEYQHGAYHLARGLQRLQRVESGLQDLCTQPVEAAARPGKQTKTIKDYILLQDNEQKDRLIKVLHSLLDNKKGRWAGLVVAISVRLGLLAKPTFKMLVAEFGDIGNESGFNKYYDIAGKALKGEINTYRKDEIGIIKDKFSCFVTQDNSAK